MIALCVHDLVDDRDVFFRGTRIKEKPESLTATIDAPFYSHLRDGGDHLVYRLDNSWATGKVFVTNLKTNTINSFKGRNGHIKLDVSFSPRRIALTDCADGLR